MKNQPYLLGDTCLVQIILKDLTVLQVEMPLHFFVKEVIGKSLRFMPDIPASLLKFSDRLDECLRKHADISDTSDDNG